MEKSQIIPLLLMYDQFATNFNKNVNNFNKYFSNQCSVIDISNKLPMDQALYTTPFLSSVGIKQSDILNIPKKSGC